MYRGGDLQDLFRASTTAQPTRRLLHDVADRAGAVMTTFAKANTPVDTGRTRASFEQQPVERVRVLNEHGYQSGVQSSYWKARLIEHEVRPHDVAPKTKQALSTPHGPRAGARHPGQAGTHAVAKAVAETEAVISELAQPSVRAWATQIEASAKAHKGID